MKKTKTKRKTILLVGGGTGGHIFPLRSVADEFLKKKWNVELVLHKAELDQKISQENFKDISCHFLSTEKIRRYFDWKNFWAPFKIIQSIQTSLRLLQKIKPTALFLKGGFVSFPILLAAQILNIRKKSAEKIHIFSHESDISVGVITVLCRKFSDKTFESFGKKSYPLFFEPKTKIPGKKLERGLKKDKTSGKKNLLVFGGSQGSQFINKLIEKNISDLLKKFSVTLVTGDGKLVKVKKRGFTQTEMMPPENLRKKIYESDLIISRAGANSLFEILAAKKPSIIIPLPSSARDHQTKNAEFFVKRNLCFLLKEEKASEFLKQINEVQKNRILQKALQKSSIKNAASEIVEEIEKFLGFF